VTLLEGRLVELGTPERAAKERGYLRSELTHLGVSVPQIRRATKRVLKEAGVADPDAALALAEALWAPGVHELRFAATEVVLRFASRLEPGHLPVVEGLLRGARTWALLDPLAVHGLGPMVQAHPAALAPVLEAWAVDEDFWMRRAALLAHLAALRRGEGDFERFGRLADGMLEERGFFIRKAIGWVLRDLGRKRPQLVDRWISPRTHRASGVTMREAVKCLDPVRGEALMAAYRAGEPCTGG
jgi:3-methyladenine DNA glycosylase AlkD